MARSKRLSTTALRGAALCAFLLLATPAAAQDASDQAAGGTGQPALLGDIIVTAQKRDQNIQDVPVSISAFSGNQLQQLGMSNATAITQQIPGMHLNAWSPNITIFNLRGISQNNFQDNLEAPVAVYMDNAYMGSMNGIAGQLFDVERVEVLRGPQGTLFGRNATGGLVHYLSRPAKEKAFNGYLQGSYGRFDERSLEGAIGGQIVEGWRARLSMRRALGGNYIKSADTDPANGLVGNGQNIGGQNAFALRATTQIDVTPDLMVELWYKYSRDHNVPTGGYVFDNCELLPNGFCHVNPVGLTEGSGGVINALTGAKASPYDNFSNTPGFLNRRVHIGQADINWDLGGVALTSITNYTNLKKAYREDGDASPLTIIIFDTSVKYRQFSQELRFSGETGRLKWQVGAYYLDMRLGGGQATRGAPALGTALQINGAANDPLSLERYTVRSKNYSAFAQGEYGFTDTLSLIAGLRYSKDRKSLDYISQLIDTPFPDALITTDESFAAILPGVNKINYEDYAARLSLNWKPDPDTLIFASYNRGIKGGNWTISPVVSPENFRHDPETLHSFELGAKWATANRRLRINGTLFHYIYDDYQSFAMVGGTPQVANSDARATGAEIELTWQPVDRLNMLLGGTWEKSKVKSVRGAGEQFAPELFPGAPDAEYCTNIGGAFFCDFPQDTVKNAKLPNTPRFSVNYLARYDFDVAGGVGAVQVDGAWYDDQYLEVTNGRSSLQPGYNVTNASISWKTADDLLELTLWGKNVFDKAYRAYTLNLGVLGTSSYYAAPATYGATISLKW